MQPRGILVAVVSLLGASGCSRDLDVPSSDRLSLIPAAVSVAPREGASFRASGGAGAYRFRFASDGRLSGPSASIDPATGTYRAGSVGPVVDLVEVVDAAGEVAQARVAVGVQLQVVPFISVTAPGGEVVLRASGGKPPYTFTLDGQPASTLAADTGGAQRYRAGPLGSRTETVIVRDATFDAADLEPSVAVAEIRVGAPLAIYASTAATVAPFEVIEFLAVGGQPPYTFTFANAVAGVPPSGGSIDATGRYVAGPVGADDGSVLDEVTVADAFGQVAAPIRVRVGAPLALALAAGELSPGVPASLVATGGKPPYGFGFDVRGNRSRGTVDEVTGAYVPGPGLGMSDVLAVTDATGRARATLAAVPVGAHALQVAPWSGRVVPARLRGDVRVDTGWPRDDVVFFRYDSYSVYSGMTAVFMPEGMAPFAEALNDRHGEGEPFVLDSDGDGHDEVVVFGNGFAATFVPDLAGHLALGPVLTLPAGYSYVAQSAADARRFYTGFTCPGGTLAVDVLDPAPVTTCIQGGAVLPGPYPAPVPAFSGVAQDLDGDGFPDVAVNLGTHVRIQYGTAAGLGAVHYVALPAGCSATYVWQWQNAGRIVLAPSSDPADPRTYVHLPGYCASAGGAPRPAVLRLDASPRPPLWSPAGPVDIGRAGSGTFLMAAYAPGEETRPIVLTWGGADTAVTSFSIDPGGSVTTFDPLPRRSSGVSWATLPDVNGDGVADLLLAGPMPVARLYLGDGDGRFGGRARCAGMTLADVTDVDGDGLEDVVGLTADFALAVLFGGEHQLAWGPTTPVAPERSMMCLAAGDFGRPRKELLFQRPDGSLARSEITAEGAFGAPREVTLQVHGPTTTGGLLESLHRAHVGGPLGVGAWSPSIIGATTMATIVFDTETAARMYVSPGLPHASCARLPVGAGDASGPAELAALCVSGAELSLQRASWSATGYGPWVEDRRIAGAGGEPAFALAAGRGGGAGRGYFVAAAGGAAGRDVAVYEVSTSGSRGSPFVVREQVLGSAVAIPHASALVADLDGDGAEELIVMKAGAGLVFPGSPVAGGLSFGPGSRVGAAGVPFAAAQLAPGGKDLLTRMAGDLVIVRNAGGAALE